MALLAREAILPVADETETVGHLVERAYPICVVCTSE